MTSTLSRSNNVRLRTTPVFAWNYTSTARTKINQGGTSSGKTYAILQVIFLRLIDRQRVATVVGQDIPNLKKGALRDFQSRILPENPWMNEYIQGYNKTERTYTFKNGSLLEFTSYKDAQDAKNGKRDILFANEANGVPWPIFEQLEMRTSEEVFVDYNPTAAFYAHERLMPRHNSVTFYSNFTHNRFIDDSVREYILSLRETDIESWKVYGLGKTGAIHNLVFPKIKVVKTMPKFLKKRAFGLDLGYRASPTALIECGYANERDLYLHERFYLHNMKTDDIHLTFKAMGLRKGVHKIFADPADPRAIDDLKAYGWKIIEAIKGADSVNYGIQLLNQYNIHITATSLNLLNEQRKYSFKEDKNGKMTNDPIKAWDHGWDATRYYGAMNLKPLRRIYSSWRGAVA